MKSSQSKMPKRRPRKNSKKGEPVEIQFRERRLSGIDFSKIKHPKPNKDYKATLPGPPGWQYKIDPGQ